MKIKLKFAILLLLVSAAAQAQAGMTTTQSYKITLTIPESVGTQALLPALALTPSQPIINPSSRGLMIVQETIRDREKIVLQSFVSK